MTCRGCNHFDQKDTEMGECHKNPPTVFLIPKPGMAPGVMDFTPASAWPIVRCEHWCSEYMASKVEV